MPQREKSKRLEEKLLRELRRNSSQTISGLSRRIDEPVTTVFEAERKLRMRWIVTRYCPALDFEKAGFTVRAFFMMRVDDSKLEETAGMLMEDKNVNNLQLLEGDCNLLAEAVFRGIEQFLEFSEKLSRLKKTSVYYALKEIKKEAAAVY